ncbi:MULTISPECIES: hypothetical protein [Paenibacillus]|uniref:hypothetical protein n=1 Tax=Paenibacillus TaxID=44249 RepID=UPI0022B8CC68|nr:hypothetical protein [Paenibacillus caseinilyticus]MCZ8521057.1 hypothetical protein [Paenibacillus caseinilyticus]
MMKKSGAALLLAALLLLGGCGDDAALEERIDMQVASIASASSAVTSSSPGDYIAAERERYDEIVSLGEAALPHLLNELRGAKGDSLEGWIRAKACEDILQEESPVKSWSTGGEWIRQYDEARRKGRS